MRLFHKREGHCRVARGKEVGGVNLGGWVIKQRYKKDSLTSDQLKRLNSLGFSWDRLAAQWEKNYVALQQFHKREGHCRVAQSHAEDGLSLGGWVSVQRTNKEKLKPDQLKRLNSLGFSWDPMAEQWEQNYTALKIFHKRVGLPRKNGH